MGKFLSCLFFALLFTIIVKAEDEVYILSSPDKNILVEVVAGERIVYSVMFNGLQILAPSAISMTLDNGRILGKDAQVKNKYEKTVNKKITPQFIRRRFLWME